MDYKNMSTDEIIREYNKWTPNPADAVPVQNAYYERQMKLLSSLTPQQSQAVVAHMKKSMPSSTESNPLESIFVLVGGGILFLVMWRILGSL